MWLALLSLETYDLKTSCLCPPHPPHRSSNTQSQHTVVEMDRITQQTPWFIKQRSGGVPVDGVLSNSKIQLGRYFPLLRSEDIPGIIPILLSGRDWPVTVPWSLVSPLGFSSLSSSSSALVGGQALEIHLPWGLGNSQPTSVCRRLEIKGNYKLQPQALSVFVRGFFGLLVSLKNIVSFSSFYS